MGTKTKMPSYQTAYHGEQAPPNVIDKFLSRIITKIDGRSVPKNTLDTIPFEQIYPGGLCRVCGDYYTRMVQFYDINYQLAQNDEKQHIFGEYCQFLNYFDESIHKEMDADVERKGLGTTATRADIIEKMIKQGYVRREKKLFVPTDDGMNLINVLPEQIKSVSMTVDMENMLAQVAKGEVSDTEYLHGITDFVTEIISRYSAISEDKKDLFSSQNKIGTCPVCHGDVVRGKFGVYCTKKCGMKFGRIGGKEATEKQWADVLAGKQVLMKGLKSKKGTTYDAYFTPTDIEEFSYKDKQGKKHEGLQYVFEISFPKRKNVTT